jgi:multiple sugar transport system substrate-binding protein
MRVRAILLAAALVLAPLDARAADLVVWWAKGFYPEEDQAVRELVAAFGKETGREVQLAFYAQQGELPARTAAAVEAGRPPDFVYGIGISLLYFPRWAHEGRLVDLTDALGPSAAQFDKDAIADATLLDGSTGRRGLYALPMGRNTNHVHAWRSLLERAGLTLGDVPKEWEPFWSFWCDKVQPAVRKATGREDFWGVGLPMGAAGAGDNTDTGLDFRQFVHAYEADYVTRDGKLVIDEPEVRAGLIEALAAYTEVWRQGCTPPASADWDGAGNNGAFLAQAVVMTVNGTLSIPGALRATRPEDYYKNAVTLEWPSGARGQPLAIYTGFGEAAIFKAGRHAAAAKEFVRFLVGEGWLAHWLDFAGDRFLPVLARLTDQPFWLDPGDTHRMSAVMQVMTYPQDYGWWGLPDAQRRHEVGYSTALRTAVHRIVVDGLTPEQAADEAIARVHQLLSTGE